MRILYTMPLRALAFVALLLTACSGQAPQLFHPTDPATDFYVVSPGIYRGGRLDQAGVQRLQRLGVKTILNLENDNNQIALEAIWAKSAAITQVSMPMSGFWQPDDRQVDGILKLLADPSKRPIYVHCKKGMDRTGIVIALHRVFNEGWTEEQAEAERDAIGFNSWLARLDSYYEWKAARYIPVHRNPRMDQMLASGGQGANTTSHASQ